MPARSASSGLSPAPAAKEAAPSTGPSRGKSKEPNVKNEAKSSKSSAPVVEPTYSSGLNPVAEAIKFVMGLAMLAAFAPFVVWQIFWCTIWEFGDKKLVGGISAAMWFSERVGPKFSGMMRNPKDGFVVLLLIWLGIVMPAAFFFELWNFKNEGGFDIMNWKHVARCLAFNLVRIGPMYANFMWVYVMCHKEAHCMNGSLFAKGICDKLFNRAFNHWVGK